MNANLPALILVAVLLFTWQAAAMGIDAAYILPSPVQVVVRLWELRVHYLRHICRRRCR